MCGIAGTTYSKKFTLGSKIDYKFLLKCIKDYENKKINAVHLLEVIWKYKSNINFLRFCRSSSEQNKIKQIAEKLLELQISKKKFLNSIDKSSSLNEYNTELNELNNLKDCHWFLYEEINKLYNQISYLCNNKTLNLNDSEIIFYKKLQIVINSIDNRLELRGRDSFGISIQIVSDRKEKNIKSKKSENTLIFKSQSGKSNIYIFNFKTCSSIGELGDNAKVIIDLIRNCSQLSQLIINGHIKNATIIAHTRWASVGEVNLKNSHPIVLRERKRNGNATSAILNGDIYNYNLLIKESQKKNKCKIDKSIETDCLAIPFTVVHEKKLNNHSLSKISNNYQGSYAFALQNILNPFELFICKKGNQGLYLGLSEDGIMFASDVYGLVETCSLFIPLENDIIFNLDARKDISSYLNQIKAFNTSTKKNILINFKKARGTNITTRDIDKKNYNFFLEKEIFDTEDIIDRTLGRYLQDSKLSKKILSNYFIFQQNEVPHEIVKKIKTKKINNVIITGMGTCYTAAVAISMYMRKILKNIQHNINVEPHIASEGSAFYLKNDMKDTLVLVIAQSGTTIDTNVYVQMAKDRGAATLAIANKREGDVTFIVDGTLYIGDGRDIEIAVPSTKTYTAQVVLGYILTLYIASFFKLQNRHKQLLVKQVEGLINARDLVKQSLSKLCNEEIYKRICLNSKKYNSWYILQDSSYNSVCASEIRIKFSENCYQSVPYLNIENATNYKIASSFITLISNSNTQYTLDLINKILKKQNFLVLISANKINKQKIINKKNFFQIEIPKSDKYLSFIPTIIAGQFFSMYLAIYLDKRKLIFESLVNTLKTKSSFKKTWDQLQKSIKSGDFNQGFNSSHFYKLKQHYNAYEKSTGVIKIEKLKKLEEFLYFLKQHSRRTIDTVKHQAKTITVGAIRSSSIQNPKFKEYSFQNENMSNKLEEKYIAEFENIIKKFFSQIVKKNLANKLKYKKEILIHYHEVDEAFAYNLVNTMNEEMKMSKNNIFIRLAQPYDYEANKIDQISSTLHILITLKKVPNSVRKINNSNLAVFSFSKETISKLRFFKINDVFILQGIWTYFLSIFINNLIHENNGNETPTDNEIKANYLAFRQTINRMNIKVHNELNLRKNQNAVDYFLSRRNWKTIGSGINYNLAKYTAKRIINETKRACAFDVLENHKHIDISAESAIIVFVSNIRRPGYQEDAFSEIEKIISHENLPIIVTDDSDFKYDNLKFKNKSFSNEEKFSIIPVVKIPRSNEHHSFISSIIFVNEFIRLIKRKIKSSTNRFISFNDSSKIELK